MVITNHVYMRFHVNGTGLYITSHVSMDSYLHCINMAHYE